MHMPAAQAHSSASLRSADSPISMHSHALLRLLGAVYRSTPSTTSWASTWASTWRGVPVRRGCGLPASSRLCPLCCQPALVPAASAAGQLLNLPHLQLSRLPAMARLAPGLYYFIISTRHPRHKPCCLPAGALSRMLERGARSVAMVFRALVFTFVPTLVELVAVCALLGASFHARVGGLVVATFGAYAAWTVALTRVRGRL